MEWIQNNWFWLALAVGFVAMHMFGHGGHRHGHGGHGREGWRSSKPKADETAEPGTEDANLSGNTSATVASNLTAARGVPAHDGHSGTPTPSEQNRHRHGC